LKLAGKIYPLNGCSGAYFGGAQRETINMKRGQSLETRSDHHAGGNQFLRSTNEAVLRRNGHSFTALSPGRASIAVLTECAPAPGRTEPSASPLPAATTLYGSRACYIYDVVVT
jgi:hypothetical protein